MERRKIRFGVIGCGLMGREFASAAMRWRHLLDLDFEPKIVAACDTSRGPLEWFERNVDGLELATSDYCELLAHPGVEAVYIAVPHHLHAPIYIDALRAGKHLLGEKPFGIDLGANTAILQAIEEHPGRLVRCSSEFPFCPGAYRIAQWARQGRFGRIIEVEAGFWHSSDLDPDKPINWKRIAASNGEYGCLGDLGMHVVHLPLRLGWAPKRVYASLSKIVCERPDKAGNRVLCDTWDNASLVCQSVAGGEEFPEEEFPMTLSCKRIAPGHANTWFIKVYGMSLSAEFTTKAPKQLAYLPYTPGGAQEWHVIDMPYQTAYATITGPNFEFGFSDAILQMWAAFCDELVHGKEGMHQPLTCATPEETAFSHRLFTAALQSHRERCVVELT